jgi:hypothetical protein
VTRLRVRAGMRAYHRERVTLVVGGVSATKDDAGGRLGRTRIVMLLLGPSPR